MSYPPADDRLRHLLAQRINCHVDTWKLAFFIAGAIVDDPDIRAELDRIAAAHASGQPCGDRNCRACFTASTTAAAVSSVPPPADRAASGSGRAAEAELYVLLRKAGEARYDAQALIDRHRDEVLRRAELRRVAAEEQPAETWAANRAAITAELLPVWEAVYEPGNVSDYLIGYANDQDAATGMAEAWMRSQAEVTGRLEWTPWGAATPLPSRYDAWFELVQRHDDGIDTGPGIIVRRRIEPAAEEQPAETQDSLPAWLYQRFMPDGVGWESLDADDRSYWDHQARAVRRAVARGGFKADAEQPAVGEQPETQETPVLPCSYWTHTRTEHTPHRWEPQPGMDPVHCPGYSRTPE